MYYLRLAYINNLITHLHVYSSMSLNGHIDMQVNKLNISIFSFSVQGFKLFILHFYDLIYY